MTTNRWTVSHWLVAGSLFVLALVVRLYRLDAQSLWLDEGSTWQTIQHGWDVLLADLFSPAAAYPLYHVLLKLWVTLAGDSEWMLRFPSALAGAAAIPAIYVAAVELQQAGEGNEALTPNPSPRGRGASDGNSPSPQPLARQGRGASDGNSPSPQPLAYQGRGASDGNSPSPQLLSHQGRGASDQVLFPFTAALLMLASPFAIWYAQEAKVYSLFLLTATLLLWSLLHALRCETRAAWALYAVLAIVSMFVHRFALLLLIASFVALFLNRKERKERKDRATEQRGGHDVPGLGMTQIHENYPRIRRLLWLAVGGLAIGTVGIMVFGLGNEEATTGAHIAAGPGLATWLTFIHFSVNRGPGEFPWWWLVPWAVLTAWGTLALVRDGSARSRILACFLLIPLGLFLAQLAFTRLYEARYLMVVCPAWILLLAYPALYALPHRATYLNRKERKGRKDRTDEQRDEHQSPESIIINPNSRMGTTVQTWYAVPVALALAISVMVLTQPGKGLFSGEAVKEQFREAIALLAKRVHPDDVIVLHPAYMEPLYSYYMQRYTTDPPPPPALFAAFKKGQTEFTRRDWDAARRDTFAGHFRSFLLISPDHARTVDIPNKFYNDEYGLVGIYFQFSREEKKWPCGIWRFNGAHVLCQESPEAYETGEVAKPATPMDAQFGDDLQLLGYTLKETIPGTPRTYRAGGSIPISLFWDVTRQLDTDYSIFLHLCQQCDLPPVASNDGPPLDGYLPTSTWLPNKPARDDRTIPLPHDMPPGRYTLLLGMYSPANPAPEARVPVSGIHTLAYDRLILAEVEVIDSE